MEEKASHYFIEDDTLVPNIETFVYYFKDSKFTFTSNSGMFSPGHTDYASGLLMQMLPQLSGSLLDLGCGWGVIGIVLGKYYNLDVTMADINGRALECAKNNCKQNNFEAEIIKSDCFENIDKSFDTITLNPPIHAGKNVIFDMYDGAYAHLNTGGKFYIVIQKKHGAQSSIQKLNDLFSNCEILYKKKGYFILCCTK